MGRCARRAATPAGRSAPSRKVAGAPSPAWGAPPLFREDSNTASYAPFLYTPAAAGMGLGPVADMTPTSAVVLGRAAAALVYLVVGGMAVWCCESGRLHLLCVLLSPMSLFLAGSIGQDGLIIASSARGA